MRGIKHSYHSFLGGYLSNNYLSSLTIDGVAYLCGSQYIESQKALLFKDDTAYDNIMSAINEREVEKASLKNFDKEIWKTNCEHIYRTCLNARLEQDKMFTNYLVSIEEDIIVYCDKSDAISGVGLSMFDTNVDNPLYWEGDNLYGFLLTEIRDKLKGKDGE